MAQRVPRIILLKLMTHNWSYQSNNTHFLLPGILRTVVASRRKLERHNNDKKIMKYSWIWIKHANYIHKYCCCICKKTIECQIIIAMKYFCLSLLLALHELIDGLAPGQCNWPRNRLQNMSCHTISNYSKIWHGNYSLRQKTVTIFICSI